MYLCKPLRANWLVQALATARHGRVVMVTLPCAPSAATRRAPAERHAAARFCARFAVQRRRAVEAARRAAALSQRRARASQSRRAHGPRCFARAPDRGDASQPMSVPVHISGTVQVLKAARRRRRRRRHYAALLLLPLLLPLPLLCFCFCLCLRGLGPHCSLAVCLPTAPCRIVSRSHCRIDSPLFPWPLAARPCPRLARHGSARAPLTALLAVGLGLWAHCCCWPALLFNRCCECARAPCFPANPDVSFAFPVRCLLATGLLPAPTSPTCSLHRQQRTPARPLAAFRCSLSAACSFSHPLPDPLPRLAARWAHIAPSASTPHPPSHNPNDHHYHFHDRRRRRRRRRRCASGRR